MKTNIKLRVTPEQSEAVQKICFANTIIWKPTNFNKYSKTVKYIFINQTNLTQCRPTSEGYFETHPYTEVDADLFIRTNGTCEESIELVDNSSNCKSKEDMFKRYGFEVPNFDCTILAKVNNNYIGYATIPSSTIVALSWALNGIAYMGVTHTPQYNLPPIKKPWYETCKFPILVWDKDNNAFLLYRVDNFTTDMLNTFRPLSNDEIDQLKQDF